MHVLYPGSFDPPTLGHRSLIERAAKLFSKVTVVVSVNAQKKDWIDRTHRLELLEEMCSEWKNVRVIIDEGLVVDCAKREKADVLLKGIRSSQDIEHEKMMATVNQKIGKGVETLFMFSVGEFVGISSSLVRQIHQMDGALKSFVPDNVLNYLKNVK